MMYLKELGDEINRINQKNFQIVQIKEKYGCYDLETEVLTQNGWKFFKDLSYEDEIATLNKNGYLEYQNPTEIIAEHYYGKMYRLENRGISLCVTPNHNLYVAKGSYFTGVKGDFQKQYYDFELCKPEKYYGKDKRFLKTCKWEGIDKYKKYKIKGIEYTSPKKANDSNSKQRHYIAKDLEFDMIPWLRFLGFYIAEGCVNNRKNKIRYNEISVYFNPYDEVELVKKLINEIGFKPNINIDKGAARFTNTSLGMWLNENCGHGAINKKIPQFIKELPSEYIEEFLKYLFIGDGHKTNTSNILTTISKQLSDDVQELLLKAGYSFRETKRDRTGRFGGYGRYGNEIISRHPSYEINWLQLPDIEIDMSKAKKTKTFQEEWINYSGCVYCVTVPNHIIYIRRNGKGVWCGNSHRVYTNGAAETVYRIIDKYETISEHLCYYCGREAPMTNTGWIMPMCLDCFIKRNHRISKSYGEKPISEEELIQKYNNSIIDEPDENGEYKMPNSYKITRYEGGQQSTIEYDISDTVNKIRKRQSKWHKGKN